MERVRNSVADILDGTTLAALVDGISCARKSLVVRKSIEKEAQLPVNRSELSEAGKLEGVLLQVSGVAFEKSGA
jgi:hypothetical protein